MPSSSPPKAFFECPCAGTEHYERFLRESLYRIAGIRHTRSTFALRALKHAISVDPLLLR